jgi:tripartite-type tricarboxylate transporter receptor subunit TctC
MIKSRKVFLPAIAGLALVLAATLPSLAQTYPSRVIRIMVPAGPGGPTDVFARLIAQRIGPLLGGDAIAENRPGAGGAIAAKYVATSAPDGHTLMLGNTSTLATIPAFAKTPDYDPIKGFAPVASVADSFSVLSVRADSPIGSLKELVAFAKANPGKLNFGSAGHGNFTHLAAELLKLNAGIDLVHVPYKGVADAMTALLGGQVQLVFGNPNVTTNHVQAGRLKALAVTSATRSRNLPDVPTMKEAGIDDFVVTSFFGIAAPAGTDPAIVARLNAAINESLKSDELRTTIVKLGSDPVIGTPQEFAATIAADFSRWTSVAKSTSVKIE